MGLLERLTVVVSGRCVVIAGLNSTPDTTGRGHAAAGGRRQAAVRQARARLLGNAAVCIVHSGTHSSASSEWGVEVLVTVATLSLSLSLSLRVALLLQPPPPPR